MRVRTSLLVMTAVLFAATGTVVAADNAAPLADAGVDQTVVINSTVYLDASGSVDSDGSITTVDWTVAGPDSETVSPDCANCRRTEFDANTVGRYTVTLTVTDDDGATRSDTLYVTATDESGPNVSLSGPSSTAPNTARKFVMNVSKDEAPLQTVTWLVNGSVAGRRSVNGSSATASLIRSFDSPTSVRAVVYDTLGDRGSATRHISIDSDSGGGGTTYTGCYAVWCGGEQADMRYTIDGETTYSDTDNDGKIQTYEDGELVSIDPDSSNVKKTSGGAYDIIGGTDDVVDQYKTDMVVNDNGKAVPESEYSSGDGSNDDGGGGGSDDGGSDDSDDSGGGGGSDDSGGGGGSDDGGSDDGGVDYGGSDDGGVDYGGSDDGGSDDSGGGGGSDDGGDDGGGGLLGGLIGGGGDDGGGDPHGTSGGSDDGGSDDGGSDDGGSDDGGGGILGGLLGGGGDDGGGDDGGSDDGGSDDGGSDDGGSDDGGGGILGGLLGGGGDDGGDDGGGGGGILGGLGF